MTYHFPPAPYFEPASGPLLNGWLSSILRTITRRTDCQTAVLALAADCDTAMAADPDETAHERLSTIADALCVSPELGFLRGVRRNLDEAATDHAREHYSCGPWDESPHERPVVSVWEAREAEAARMLDAVMEIELAGVG